VSFRARTLAAGTAMAMLLSGCILFPPFWFPTDPTSPGSEIVVENETDADWVLSLGGDVPAAFAIGAGDVGTVTPFGPEPTGLVLLDTECAEVDRIDWDGSAAGVRIAEPGTLSPTDAAPADAATGFVEYWECMEAGFGAAPEPGAPLPEAGGTILLLSGDGAAFVLDVASATVAPLGEQTGDGMDGEHAWSQDGSRMAFTRQSVRLRVGHLRGCRRRQRCRAAGGGRGIPAMVTGWDADRLSQHRSVRRVLRAGGDRAQHWRGPRAGRERFSSGLGA
jgi:hypothetical protein